MKQEQPYILSLRLSPEQVQQLRRLAQDHQRSLHGEVLWAVREYLARQAKLSPKEQTPDA